MTGSNGRLALVTGATGFVGSVLCERLAAQGYRVRAALRTDRPVPTSIAEKVIVGEIGSRTDWSSALEGVSAVIHTAARVHEMHDAGDNAVLYTETNALGARRLAEACVNADVRRLLFLSSIKVNGEGGDRTYTHQDQPAPQDSYGASKWLAEQSLLEVAARSKLEVVNVRPPLLYGPRVRANFLRLLQIVDRQWPLPFGSIDNRRSLASVWNLCDFLALALEHPAAAGRTWLVSDGEDLSTPGLIRRIAHHMRRRARLIPVPVPILFAAGAIARRSQEIQRLCGSLSLDISPARGELGWSPPLTIDEGLARTVTWYEQQVSAA